MSKIRLDTSSFATMGGCMAWMRRKKLPSRKLTLAIFGLDNAGKTVTALGLKGDPLDTLAPTIGFNAMEFKFGRFDITMYDLGGGKGIRDIWKNYFAEVYGIVYVLDSTERERFAEAKFVLLNLLENARIAGKPLLVLANKQDMEGAMDEIDIIEAISLEELVNVNKCPCRIETCAAIKGQGKKLDKAIQSGFLWLLETIDGDFENLNSRVEKDMETQRKVEEGERKLRSERFRKIQEERERKEEEELAANGGVETEITENPFKPLDVEELTKKEEEEKKARKAAKLQQAQLEAAEDNSDTAHDIPSSNAVMPPISPRKTKQSDDSNNSNNVEDVEEFDEDVISTYTNKTIKPPPRTGSPIPTSPIKSRSSEFIDEESDGDLSLSGGILSSSIPPPRRLIPLDGGTEMENDKKKRKRKKRRIRRNQTAPLVEEEESGSKENVSTPSLQLGWGTPTPPSSSASLHKNFSIRSLQLEPVTELNSQKAESPEAFNAVKWGLAEDLPEIIDERVLQSNTRSGPNYSDDIVT
ncbi:uncharacterized protein LOC141912688 [Tubulanus polymorphus]|uniref:uncharacterized protein LOC141912688 n=1 Tax=Tubulanus polymorphus TaxID=672921 RepID=UPI003DA2FD80